MEFSSFMRVLANACILLCRLFRTLGSNITVLAFEELITTFGGRGRIGDDGVFQNPPAGVFSRHYVFIIDADY